MNFSIEILISTFCDLKTKPSSTFFSKENSLSEFNILAVSRIKNWIHDINIEFKKLKQRIKHETRNSFKARYPFINVIYLFFSILLVPTLLFSFFIFICCCYCINISVKFASGLVVFLEDCICKNPNSVAVKNLSFESPKAKKMKNAVHEGDSTSF